MTQDFFDNRQIRIFISSTFRDMQAERDYLITKVFPSLRKYCEERDVNLFELDLRWGISEEEAKQGKVFEICLKEVIKTKPFFIGLLGERYGWIPAEEERKAMADNTVVFEDFPWVSEKLIEGTSITEIEIMEGVLRSKEKMNAYFYFRSPRIETPQEFREKKGSHEEKKLSTLKKSLHEQSVYSVKEYDSIEALGSFVEKDFKALVDELFPQGSLSPFEKERLRQRIFLKGKTGVYVPNKELNAALEDFTKSDKSAVVITGASGMGKSALLANWIKERQDKSTAEAVCTVEALNEKIIYHFIGASQSEGDYRKIINRLADEVRDIFSISTDAAVSAQSSIEDKNAQSGFSAEEELQTVLFSLPEIEKLIIVLDGIDLLDDTENAKLLNWILPYPSNVKMIFSALPDDRSMEAFERRACQCINIEALKPDSRKQIVTDYLRSFSKALAPSQVNQIASDAKTENPLVLLSILDELRIFGVHEKLDERINHYLGAPDSESVFALVLKRIEEIFADKNTQKNIAKDILSLIAVSRNGLSETEILELSGAAPFYWSQLLNGIAGHLTMTNGLVFFSSRMMQNAAKKRYAPDIETENPYRARIASLMKTHVSFNRKCDELPYQLFMMNDWDKLYDFLIDLNVFNYIYKKDVYEAGGYWRFLRDTDSDRYSMEKYFEITAKDKDSLYLFYKNVYDFLQIIFSDKPLELKFAVKLKDLCEEVYGTEDERTAVSYNMTGSMYGILNQFNDGLSFLNQALDIQKRIYKKNNQAVSLSYVNIGNIYLFHSNELYSHRNKTAIENYEKALEVQRELSAENKIEAARIYSNMGIAYRNLEDYEKALECNYKAMEIMERILGKNHSHTASAYTNIANCYYLMDDRRNALEYFKKAAVVFETLLDKDNNIVWTTISNVGVLYSNIGDYRNAIKYLEKSMVLQERKFGRNHLNTAISYSTISGCYSSLGDNDKALEYKNQAISIYEALVQEDSDVIKNIPDEFITAEICLTAVNNSYHYLEYVPEELKTPELCLTAVRINALALEYVPEELKTEEICLMAVQDNSYTFRYMPKKFMTQELCLSGVKRNGFALENIPEEFKTHLICLEAVKEHGGALQYVPDNFKTPQICLEAVKRYASAFEYVPEELITAELCSEAVKNSVFALQYIQDKFKTYELCMTAVQKMGCELQYVPEEYKTDELCRAAVENHYDAIKYVPEKIKTKEFCLLAAQKNSSALKYTPDEYKTYEFCFALVLQDASALCDIPEIHKTPELCLLAVRQKPYALEYVPDILKAARTALAAQLCLEAVKQDYQALSYVPAANKTKELCQMAIQQNAYALQYVPLEHRTPELCLEAVRNAGEILKYVPDECKTLELCLLAVQQYDYAIEYVPKELKEKVIAGLKGRLSG